MDPMYPGTQMDDDLIMIWSWSVPHVKGDTSTPYNTLTLGIVSKVSTYRMLELAMYRNLMLHTEIARPDRPPGRSTKWPNPSPARQPSLTPYYVSKFYYFRTVHSKIEALETIYQVQHKRPTVWLISLRRSTRYYVLSAILRYDIQSIETPVTRRIK